MPQVLQVLRAQVVELVLGAPRLRVRQEPRRVAQQALPRWALGVLRLAVQQALPRQVRQALQPAAQQGHLLAGVHQGF